MCKAGDIIVINEYKKDGKILKRHSFIVLSDEAGKIKGLNYDIICNVMSSFKSESQKEKKLSYPGNFQITHDDTNVSNGNTTDGYVKAEQFYYFNKNDLDFCVIGEVKEDIFNLLLEFIEDELKTPIIDITENL